MNQKERNRIREEIMEEKEERIKSLKEYLDNSCTTKKGYIHNESQFNLVVTFPKKQDAIDTMKKIHQIFQYKMVMAVKAKKLYILY